MLQVLRAFAALLVVFDHAVLAAIRAGALPEAMFPVAFRCGDSGVFIFFVISGFIMSHTARFETDLTGFKNFMLRRVVRIVPLYWVATLFYMGRLSLDGRMPSLEEIGKSLFFIPYFDEKLIYHPVLGVGWTLNFEMYFYVMFALGLFIPRKIGSTCVLLFFLASIALGWRMGWQDSLDGPVLKFLTDPIILYFMLGMCLHGALERFRRVLATPQAQKTATLSALLVFALVVVQSGDDWMFEGALLLIAPAFVGLSVKAGELEMRSCLARLGIFLGDASYSIYLTHSFVIGPARSIYARLDPGMMSAPVFIIAVMVASSLLGAVCHMYVEKPLLNFFRSAFRAAPRKPAVP